MRASNSRRQPQILPPALHTMTRRTAHTLCGRILIGAITGVMRIYFLRQEATSLSRSRQPSPPGTKGHIRTGLDLCTNVTCGSRPSPQVDLLRGNKGLPIYKDSQKQISLEGLIVLQKVGHTVLRKNPPEGLPPWEEKTWEEHLANFLKRDFSVWRQEADAFRRHAAMGSFQTSVFGFFISQLCIGQLRAHLGTTANIRPIVVGRCYNYITLVNPSLRVDCEDIWRRFEESVVLRSSFNATVDYHQMFDAVPQTWPCNRCLFWSQTRNLMHSYTAVERHFWTLEDTLVGFMFNELVWCGREKRSGFDFGSCPPWAPSRRHPVYSLWRQASQNFAEMACGNVTVLLNGSISNAFNRQSMFGSVELDGLDPCRVDYVHIRVVTNLEGPFTESCSKGSIADLIQILRSRGFRWTCTLNDETLMNLQCVQNPEQASCQRCASGFSRGTEPPTDPCGC